MISVIVPAYNIAPFLERCVNSILQQTYADLELLLVDDGSKDETPAICDRLAESDSRVRVFHKANGGVSSARNLALEHCRGDYISVIDGDDWIEPTLFEDAVRAMTETDTDVFMFEYFIDINGVSNPHSVDASCYGKLDRESAMVYSITPHNRFAWSKVFSRELLGNLRFDQTIILGEDTLFIEQILLNSKGVFYSGKPYYHYDQREGSAVRSGFKEKKLSGLTAYKRVAALFRENEMPRGEIYAKEALLNLGVQLARYASGSSPAMRNRVFRQIQTDLKPVRRDVLLAKETTQQSKLKAALSGISLSLCCKVLNGRGKA